MLFPTLTIHSLGEVCPLVLRVTAAGKRNKNLIQFSHSAPFGIGALHSASVCGGSDSIRVLRHQARNVFSSIPNHSNPEIFRNFDAQYHALHTVLCTKCNTTEREATQRLSKAFPCSFRCTIIGNNCHSYA